MSIENFKVIFLLGAGASIPAGLLTINDLTTKFFKEIENHERFEIIDNLRNNTKTYYGRNDIEAFLSLTYRLKDPYEMNIYKKIDTISNTLEINDLDTIIQKTQNFIREELESIQNIDYLSPIIHLPFVVEIFTLNYDSVIENILETNNIKYTDGFTPFWQSAAFEDKDVKFKLYKLHGSLYWFKTTNNKLIKIPIKGLDFSKNKYITNEDLSEVLIYPTIQKEKYSRIYSFLDQTFTEKLDNSNLCIIIGYSFRDKDITEKIKEAIQTNPNLWILLVSPNSSIDKLNGISDEDRPRIINIKTNIKEFFKDAKINIFVENLRQNITREKDLWNRVSSISTQQFINANHSNGITNVIRSTLIYYKELGHVERVNYILNKLKDMENIPKDIIKNIYKDVDIKFHN